jgi:glycerate kinase
MRILIAPDKFKGALGAREVAENIAAGLRDVLADPKIDIVPVADGGEGTAEVICSALGGSWLKCKVHDPIGREVEARYAYVSERTLALMEMSEAAGLRRLSDSERDPLRASTFGVGELILAATKHGAKEIIIGLGGSATNDGGFGMARALGFHFFAGANELTGVVAELQKLTKIEPPGKAEQMPESTNDRHLTRPHLQRHLPRIIAAADVRNPLLGENGASRVFGPQKGASDKDIRILEPALTKLADVISRQFHFDYRDQPGAGAAGGLGFALMSFSGATIRPGFEVVAESIELKSKLRAVDFVITGEGSLDRQTLEGKAPAGVARLAREVGRPVFAIVGRASKDRNVEKLFDGVYQNACVGMSQKENIARAAELLRENGRKLAKELKKVSAARRLRANCASDAPKTC